MPDRTEPGGKPIDAAYYRSIEYSRLSVCCSPEPTAVADVIAKQKCTDAAKQAEALTNIKIFAEPLAGNDRLVDVPALTGPVES